MQNEIQEVAAIDDNNTIPAYLKFHHSSADILNSALIILHFTSSFIVYFLSIARTLTSSIQASPNPVKAKVTVICVVSAGTMR